MVRQFKHERAIDGGEKILKDKHHVVIAGKPFTGKEALIRQICERFEGFELKNPKYKHFHLNKDTKYFIVVNEHWVKDYNIDTLEHEMKKLQPESVYVIEASQKFVEQNEHFRHEYADAIVDLSSDEYELNEREKREVLDIFCNDITSDEFPDQKREQVCQYKPRNYGFYHLCEKVHEAKEFEDPLGYMERIDSGED